MTVSHDCSLDEGSVEVVMSELDFPAAEWLVCPVLPSSPLHFHLSYSGNDTAQHRDTVQLDIAVQYIGQFFQYMFWIVYVNMGCI